MVIVALIGLLATLAIPSFIKVRKQSQAKRIVNDARVIDAAVDAWAMEFSKADGDNVDLAAVAQYTKTGVVPTTDLLGNSFTIGPVGATQVVISASTKAALGGVAIDWGNY